MLPPRLVPVGLPGATRGALPKAARPANALHHEAIRKLGEALEEGLEETDEPKATPALREPLRHRSRAAQRKKQCPGSEGLALRSLRRATGCRSRRGGPGRAGKPATGTDRE